MFIYLDYSLMDHIIMDGVELQTEGFNYIVSINRGGLVPAACLAKQIDLPILSLYYNGMGKGNYPNIDFYMNFEIHRNLLFSKILVVADIVDTGHTMKEVVEYLNNLYPNAEIKTYCCVVKNHSIFQPDYVTVDSLNLEEAYNPEYFDIFPWETD